MRFRSIILSVSLSLLLLATQQLGIAHAIDHPGDVAQHQSQDEQVPNGSVCHLCLAFAAFNSALPGPAQTFCACAQGHLVAPTDQVVQPTLTFLRLFDSRAPPEFPNT